MRRGASARFAFNASGQLMAAATGADACIESDFGSRELLACLTSNAVDELKVIDSLRAMRSDRYPQLIESRRIVYPERVAFFDDIESRSAGGVVAALGTVNREALCLAASVPWAPGVTVQGAWDARGFAFIARSREAVAHLQTLHLAMRRGSVAFAASYMSALDPELDGIVLGIIPAFDDRVHRQLARAQWRYESSLRLRAQDRSQQITARLRQLLPDGCAGFLCPQWSGADEREVVYDFSPSYGVNADPGGPYTEAQLMGWARTGGRVRLTRSFDPGAAAALAAASEKAIAAQTEGIPA